MGILIIVLLMLFSRAPQLLKVFAPEKRDPPRAVEQRDDIKKRLDEIKKQVEAAKKEQQEAKQNDVE